jgi:hypothetical protein
MSDDLTARLLIAERAIVDKSLRHARWSGPAAHALRRILVRHVDVKVTIPDHFEKHNLAVICRGMACCEPADAISILSTSAVQESVRSLWVVVIAAMNPSTR